MTNDQTKRTVTYLAYDVTKHGEQTYTNILAASSASGNYQKIVRNSQFVVREFDFDPLRTF